MQNLVAVYGGGGCRSQKCGYAGAELHSLGIGVMPGHAVLFSIFIFIETRPSSTCVTLLNVIALGQTVWT